jgi:ABC-type branched-subunit amino acid transport system ATPase component
MILSLKNISYSFSANNKGFCILDGLNLEVERGKVTAIIGGNGSGKTTLFNILSGLIDGYDGEVLYYLEEGNKGLNLRRNKNVRKQIGRLFQNKGLFPNLSLLENMKISSSDTTGEIPFSYFIRRKKLNQQETTKTKNAVKVLNSILGEDNPYIDKLNKKGSEFSYGEQRLLSMAALAMGQYKLWLLDEPTAGVNPYYIANMKNVIKYMCETGGSILLVEHNMQFVEEVADAVAYLEDGKIACLGKSNDVLNNQNVKDSYMGLK